MPIQPIDQSHWDALDTQAQALQTLVTTVQGLQSQAQALVASQRDAITQLETTRANFFSAVNAAHASVTADTPSADVARLDVVHGLLSDAIHGLLINLQQSAGAITLGNTAHVNLGIPAGHLSEARAQIAGS